MKKIIFVFMLSLYSVSIFVFSSSLFLVGGSDMIEFVYTTPIYGKIISVVGLFLFGYLTFFSYGKNKLWVCMFFGMFLLSLISSQSVVYSGKNNQIIYAVNGVIIDSIDFDPIDDITPEISFRAPSLVAISYGEESIIYLSLFFPFSLDASKIEDMHNKVDQRG